MEAWDMEVDVLFLLLLLPLDLKALLLPDLPRMSTKSVACYF